MIVRPARAEDAGAIRALHLAAFPAAAEANLVERLERDGDTVVSLVAVEESKLLGHVLLSRMRIEGEGRAWRALGLGPVSVLPDFQRSGIGSALIHGALAVAEMAGEELIFVVGDPDYYRRFGFAPETAAPFASPYAGPFLMALALREVPVPALARADYAPAFAEVS